MFRRQNPLLLVLFTVLFSLSVTGAPQTDGGTPSLKPGDPAPELSIAEWIKGKPVKAFERGKAYVVEFWATWCPPCIRGMPHLSEVQKEWGPKGLTVISVTSEDPRNTLDSVKAMVKDKGDIMGYTVAWDEGRTTSEAWMRAAGQNGIPCSFVVDKKGDVAWVGHPMWLDTVVDKVSAREWKVERDVRKLKEAQGQLNEVLSTLRSDQKAALAKLEDFAEEYPRVVAGTFGTLWFQLLIDARQFKKAGKLGTSLVDKALEQKNAGELNQIAWMIVDPQKDVGGRGLKLAYRASLAANRITDGKNPVFLHTLARVHFAKGNVTKAIKVQKTALKRAKGTRIERPITAALDEYQAAEKKGGDEG